MGMHMPGVIEQGRAVGMVLTALDLADKQQMVAHIMLLMVVALKHSGAAFQQGHAMDGIMVRRVAEAVYALARKQLGQWLLRCRQHMDRVVRALAEHGQGVRHLTQAPEYQRRRERHGVEGADRGAHRMALRAARRDDGHARGELTQRIAKFALRKGLGSTQDRGRQGGVHKNRSTKRPPQGRAAGSRKQSFAVC